MPIHQYSEFKMPLIKARTHSSKLYHSDKVKEILFDYISELPIKREYRQLKMEEKGVSYKKFKIQKMKESRLESREDKFKTLDEKKTELEEERNQSKRLKEQSKIEFTVVKNWGEIMIGAVDPYFHQRGYKPFVRMGSLKETLTAACILEAEILEKAKKSGKLFVWDPFCGSGTFLIEAL